MAAPAALHESRGIFSFSKENISLGPPRERFTLAASILKSCTRSAIRRGVHGFAMNPCESFHAAAAPYSVGRE